MEPSVIVEGNPVHDLVLGLAPFISAKTALMCTANAVSLSRRPG